MKSPDLQSVHSRHVVDKPPVSSRLSQADLALDLRRHPLGVGENVRVEPSG